MKKFYTFFALAACLCGFNNSVKADNYKIDFETIVDTSVHDFRVADGWNHIVDGYEHPFWSWGSEYVSYSYVEGDGINGSTALQIGSQFIFNTDRNDLLVTPKVSGTVSIMVKSIAEPYDEEEDFLGEGPQVASIKFYAVANNVMGEEIVPAEAPELTTDGYVKYVLPEQEAKNIGIRGEYVSIDDFEATSANVEAVRSLKVTDASMADDNVTTIDNSGFWPTTYIVANAAGDYTLSYDVELANMGEATLNPGDEGYTLTILNQETMDVLAENLPINVSLEPGETKTANVKAALNMNTTGADFYLLIRENITASEKGYFDYRVQVKVDETTGINVATAETQQQGKAYTIGGRRAGSTPRGIVIIDGKKFNLK